MGGKEWRGEKRGWVRRRGELGGWRKGGEGGGWRRRGQGEWWRNPRRGVEEERGEEE